MTLGLVYLARGIDGGLSSAKAFFDAYRIFPAGCPHELIVISKGWLDDVEHDEMVLLAKAHAARVVELPDDGFDWGAYMRLVPELTHDWVCFLNTHSRPCVNDWLNFFKTATLGSNVGAVGATASWETLAKIFPPSSVNLGYVNTLKYLMRIIFNAVKFVPNIRDFSYFPNPHLRTNAFIVSRELFIEFTATKKIPHSKRDALKLESGRAGFTEFLKTRGLKTLVTGVDGKLYQPEKWFTSGTFRVPEQPNLLVEDNQTKGYEIADKSLKRYLEMAAWGQFFS